MAILHHAHGGLVLHRFWNIGNHIRSGDQLLDVRCNLLSVAGGVFDGLDSIGVARLMSFFF